MQSLFAVRVYSADGSLVSEVVVSIAADRPLEVIPSVVEDDFGIEFIDDLLELLGVLENREDTELETRHLPLLQNHGEVLPDPLDPRSDVSGFCSELRLVHGFESSNRIRASVPVYLRVLNKLTDQCRASRMGCHDDEKAPRRFLILVARRNSPGKVVELVLRALPVQLFIHLLNCLPVFFLISVIIIDIRSDLLTPRRVLMLFNSRRTRYPR
mmetsp:Transcript_2029/g.8021  ORF Transcript_2029/g.8021 Transcript_2029/m.8021 type:complete len:213 (-) Transcript_2029:111-749(-)